MRNRQERIKSINRLSPKIILIDTPLIALKGCSFTTKPVGRENSKKAKATSVKAEVSVALIFDIRYKPNAPPMYPRATPIPEENARFSSSETEGKSEL